MNDFIHFSFDSDEFILPHSAVSVDDWRLLRRLKVADRFNNPRSGPLKRGLVIDAEATLISEDFCLIVVTERNEGETKFYEQERPC